MTELQLPRRCAYCRRPLPDITSTGRPARYCRRSHRQRAYEARRRAERAALPAGHVVVAQADLDMLHDRLYALEAALEDVRVDLTGAGRPMPDRVPRTSPAKPYAEALAHLMEAAGDLRGLVVEPATS